ncbi:MAG: hypothetical protein A2275_06970 [Bacteroidetes bacterium RIFOXYA12_FULL_35_11]|nr:MAG: hypothetical protein A2X01_01285 [Bacteroidetes bacterium GWF2_35_48]OFY83176.1 MAG: hypothetical protein A2275_06970 [Bacteroidetes bacterium RIFOXYA12_FULL_35_11]OFY97352.1 MAG: hypothetical protein A2491_21205 [Bacteroidetes bacterium RIFOXYC12_FULL_35_7]HBX51210.1 hypothetical protein [Bacteroidales bacterium]
MFKKQKTEYTKSAFKKMSEESEHIELRSEEVQEILGHVPPGVIRWGISVISAIVILLLVASWFIKYPEIIISPVTVTTQNPPVTLVSKMNGKISKLFVKDKQRIKSGSVIAVIENPTDFNDVYTLKQKLDSFRVVLMKIQISENRQTALYAVDSTQKVFFDENLNLGEMQTWYGAFLKSMADFSHFIHTDYHQKKIFTVQDQIAKYNQLYTRLLKQQNILSEELSIDRQQFSRDSNLFAKGVLAKADFDKSKSFLLQKRYSFEGSKSTLSNTQIQISQLQQSIFDLQQQHEDQNKQLKLALSQAYENLIGQIKIWEQNYVFTSPVDGIITFTKYWNENQNILSGDKVVTIIPEAESRSIGKLQLPIRGSGKVKTGQSVNIKLDNYPYMEYGMLRGKIESISLVSSDDSYAVEVSMPNGLLSSYGKKLEFSHDMKGTAEIITEDERLIMRFINPLRALLAGS